MNSTINRIIIKNKKYLFLLAYIMYLAELIFFSSMFGEIEKLQLGFKIIRNFCYCLILLKVVLDFIFKEFKVKECYLIIIITVFLIVITKNTGNKSILIYWFFIIAAHDIKLELIVRIALLVHLFCMSIIITSSLMDILQDRIYTRNMNETRYSIGYQYTTDSSNYFLHMILMYIYIKKDKISWEAIGFLGICNLLLFKITDTRSVFFTVTITLLIVSLLKIFKFLRMNNRLYKTVSTVCVPILSSIILYLTFSFNSEIQWMNDLNKKINTRLQLGNDAYKTYGLHLLGQNIQWIGGANEYDAIKKSYNYVDSSYVQIILNFGVLFFILLCIGFIILGRKAAKNNDIYLCLILIIISVHSVLDPQLIWMAFNPFILCYSYIHIVDAP